MSLRTRFERFCYNNRDKGIPNLMLYIALGNALVCLLSMFNGGSALYQLLCFDKGKILQGQVWRLVTYVFTQSYGDMIELIFLYFFYLLGRQVELRMGTFRFNLYYLTGVILMDAFGMIFSPVMPDAITTEEQYAFLVSVLPVYRSMAYYLHLSMLLTYATMYPDSEFLIMFILPIKGWIIGMLYLLLTFVSIFNLSFPTMYFPHNLFPLVALGNYLLFMGKDVGNLIPFSWRVRKRPSAKKAAPKDPIPFRAERSEPKKPNYSHRCTICGRTDTTNPELEFRYCSRCNGYYCYCEDHINDHTHIQ
ncbi:MAG: rhomboid family intramembrane serine protease [Oscillospiraceae bacterium]|nr:rhomboid family intramembrane serine protease [Oscillospiraceae bacterium]